MSYAVSPYSGDDDTPDTVRPPPEQGKACYYCRRHQATAWAGSHVAGAGDVPICVGCSDRAKRRRVRP